jgi:hypothetical protein
MEEPVEGTPASCEGFPGEDTGRSPPSDFLGGGAGRRRRWVACGEEVVVIREQTDQCEVGAVVRGSPIHNPIGRAGPSRDPARFCCSPSRFLLSRSIRGRTCFQSQCRRR